MSPLLRPRKMRSKPVKQILSRYRIRGVSSSVIERFANASQIGQLQMQLQLTSRNAGNVQNELDDTKERLLDEKAIMRDRLDECLKDIQNMRKEKDALSETIKDMEIKLKAQEKVQQELRSRLQSIEDALMKSKQDYEEAVIQRKHLEDERSSLLRQIDDAEKLKEGLLQEIQDLRQECRYNLSRRNAPVTGPPSSQAASHLSSTVLDPAPLESFLVSLSPSVSCTNNGGQLADLTPIPCSQPGVHNINDSVEHLPLPATPCVDLKNQKHPEDFKMRHCQPFPSCSSSLIDEMRNKSKETPSLSTSSFTSRELGYCKSNKGARASSTEASSSNDARGVRVAGNGRRNAFSANGTKTHLKSESDAPTPEDSMEKGGAGSTGSAPQLFPSELRQIITASYKDHGLDHLPLLFFTVQKDLSGTRFNPYTIILASRCEKSSVVTNVDMQGLRPLLNQMTECIPPKDDNSLIAALKKFMDGTKDLPSGDSEHVKTSSHLGRLISSLDGDLTAIVNKLAEWKTHYKYTKMFMAILQYSVMVVQRFILGETQVQTLSLPLNSCVQITCSV